MTGHHRSDDQAASGRAAANRDPADIWIAWPCGASCDRCAADGGPIDARVAGGDACGDQGAGLDSAIDGRALVWIADFKESGDLAVVLKIVGVFLTESKSRVGALRLAVVAGDVPDIHRLIHSLKGSAATFGAREMVAVLDALEARIARGDLSDALDLVGSLVTAVARTETALNRIVREVSGPAA